MLRNADVGQTAGDTMQVAGCWDFEVVLGWCAERRKMLTLIAQIVLLAVLQEIGEVRGIWCEIAVRNINMQSVVLHTTLAFLASSVNDVKRRRDPAAVW